MNAENSGPKAKIAERIAAVRTRFLLGLEERTCELSNFARQAGDPKNDGALEARDSLRLGLHNLAGAAPTLGLQALGRKAAELESHVLKGTGPDGSLDAATADRLVLEIAQLAHVTD